MKKNILLSLTISYYLKQLLKASAVGLISLSISTLYLGKYFAVFDLFSHFQFQYFCVGIFLLVISLIVKQFRFALLIFLYLSLLFGFFIHPVQFRPKTVNKPNIFYMNTNFYNQDIEEIGSLVINSEPEVVVLTEINEKMRAEMAALYGEPVTEARGYGALSCAIFTKRDVITAYTVTDGEYPICITKFSDYTLILIHPIPPMSNEDYNSQKRFFKEVKQLLKEEEQFVLVGDFNSTYYSALFREYFGEYFKQNIYTWGTDSVLSIPIDHALSNKSITVHKSAKLSSDHNALFVEVEF